MKKSNFVLVILFVVLACGCTNKSKDFVYLGQMMKGTSGFSAQEKIKGHVKEFKESFFWVRETDGKIEKGKLITKKDEESTLLVNHSMTEEFNSSGIVLRSTLFNDNGENFQDYIVEAEGKIISKFLYKVYDTVRVYGKYEYEGEKPVLLTAYNAKTDSVMMSLKYEYDQNGNIIKTQTILNRNEPTSYTLFDRDLKDNLVKIQRFNKDGKLTMQFDYTYNKNGERITWKKRSK